MAEVNMAGASMEEVIMVEATMADKGRIVPIAGKPQMTLIDKILMTGEVPSAEAQIVGPFLGYSATISLLSIWPPGFIFFFPFLLAPATPIRCEASKLHHAPPAHSGPCQASPTTFTRGPSNVSKHASSAHESGFPAPSLPPDPGSSSSLLSPAFPTRRSPPSRAASAGSHS